METVPQTEPRSESVKIDFGHNAAIFEQKIADLETQRLESIDRAILLQNQVDGLQKKVSALKREKEEAVAEVESTRAANDEIKSRLGYIENSIAAKDAILSELNASASEKENLVTYLKAQAVKIPVLESRLAELEALKTKLLKENENLRVQYAYADGKVLEAEQQSESLTDRVRNLEDELRSASTRASKLEKVVAEFDIVKLSLNDKNESTLQQLEEMKGKYQSLRESLSTSDAQSQFLSEQLKQKSSELGALQNQFQSKLADSEELNLKQISTLNSEKQSLESKIINLQNSLSDSENRCESLRNDLLQIKDGYIKNEANLKIEAKNNVANLTRNIEELESTIKNMSEIVDSSQTELKNTKETLADSRAQVDALNSQVLALQKEKNDLSTAVSNLQKIIDSAKEDLRKSGIAEQNNADLTKNIEQLESTIKNMSEIVDSSQTELKNTKETLADSRSQVDALNSQVLALQKEKNEISNALVSLKAAVESATDEAKKNSENGKVFESEIARLTLSNNEAVAAKDALQRQFQQQLDALSALQNEKLNLEQKNEEISSKLNVLAKRFLDGGNEKQVALDKISELEKKLSKARQAKKDYAEQVQILEAEVANAPLEAVKSTEKVLKSEQVKVKTLEKQLRESKISVENKKFEVKGGFCINIVMTGLFVAAIVALIATALYFLKVEF